MRLAYSEQDVRETFESVKREGLASFGDDRVFIEKFVESPRHIEIQLLGDQHGTILYLGERECSVQRRHQKVVEEAPSPFVTPEMRKQMGEQAVALAQAVGYFSAGTVEFIAGADRSFYFLEMNTRLQVEHPVTELVTGLDLVEQMIRVAAGEKLAFGQEDVTLNGWAVENRVYAEDPYRGFLPSTGRLVRYSPPLGKEGVRVDDGVAEGGEVSMFYDPMIAKLITYGGDREQAIDLQVAALDSFVIDGIGHNLDFLSALMQHPRFRSGALTTGFIAEEFPEGFHGAAADERLKRNLAALGGLVASAEAERARHIDGQLGTPLKTPGRWIAQIDGEEYEVRVEGETILVGSDALAFDAHYVPGQTLLEAIIDGEPLTVKVERRGSSWLFTTRGARHKVRVLTARGAALARHMIEKTPPDLSKYLLCPMPGLLTMLHVAQGDKVEAGQPLAVVEAMKMENILRAEKAGTVASVAAKPGDSLAVDAVILEFE
jgi:propionyl-CoA carboxylase alpha chain